MRKGREVFDLNNIGTWQIIFNIGTFVIGGVVSWYVRISWEMLQELRKSHVEAHAAINDKVGKIEVLVAGEYVKRTDFEKVCESLRDTIDKGFTRIFDKLDGKADK